MYWDIYAVGPGHFPSSVGICVGIPVGIAIYHCGMCVGLRSCVCNRAGASVKLWERSDA